MSGAVVPWGSRAARAVGGVGLAVISLALGAALAAVGVSLGPAVMLGLPIGLLVTLLAVAWPRVGVALVIASLPVGSHALPLPGDVKVVHFAAMVAVGAILAHRLITRDPGAGWVRPTAWLLGIFLLALAATPGALDVSTAVKQDITLTIGVALVLAVPACCRDLGSLRPVVLWLLVVGVVVCASSFGSASQLQASFNGALVNNRAVGVFHQPNELGTFSGMLLMVALGIFFGARSAAERVISFVAAVTAVTALGLTLSRGAWIGAVLGGAMFVWLLPRARRAVLVVGIPLVALVAALGAFRSGPPQLQILTERVQSITTPAANPYDDRPAIYREGLHVVATHPVLGVGPENFIVAATKGASDTQTVAPLHAHDFLLTVAAELGIPAALLLVAMTLSVGLRIVRAREVLPSEAERALTVGLGAAFVLLVGQGFVDFTLRNPTVFMFVWLMFGMTLVAVRAVDAALDGADGVRHVPVARRR